MKTPILDASSAMCGLALALMASAMSPARGAAGPSRGVPFPTIERFENFGTAQGLPANKVHAVLKTSEAELWIGTWNGLCHREKNGQFRRFGPEDGLSHKMVLCLDEDPRTGDLWVGTMRGLNRVSAGKITAYTQTDSGLPNNVVYGVAVVGDRVWSATAAGAGELNLKTGSWKIYDHNNSLMHEPWCYSVTSAGDKVMIGVWGGGIIEYRCPAWVLQGIPRSGWGFSFRSCPGRRSGERHHGLAGVGERCVVAVHLLRDVAL